MHYVVTDPVPNFAIDLRAGWVTAFMSAYVTFIHLHVTDLCDINLCNVNFYNFDYLGYFNESYGEASIRRAGSPCHR